MNNVKLMILPKSERIGNMYCTLVRVMCMLNKVAYAQKAQRNLFSVIPYAFIDLLAHF